MDEGYLFNTYERFNISFVQGEGCLLFDEGGQSYLDFTSGISVVNLGHSNNEISKIVSRQAAQLIHTSNLFNNKNQEVTAKKLSDLTGGGSVFFCNSGAEANEAAIKLVRAYGNKKFEGLRYKIITMENSFHGRTFATLSATGQNKVKVGFEPTADFFIHIPFNDFEAFYDIAKCNNVVAVMLELIQGEGGVVEANRTYIDRLKSYCAREEILLICDEIQTGMGRTGHFLASEIYDVKSDIITMAKALGNGIPIGAMIAEKSLVTYLPKGSHGSTFGGNHLACAAAEKVLDIISGKDFLENVKDKGVYFKKRLTELFNDRAHIRGYGLLLGVHLIDLDMREFINKCIENGLLLIPSANNTIRVYPPLIVSYDEIDRALDIMSSVLKDF